MNILTVNQLTPATDYGHTVRKLPSLHGRKSNPNPKFLGTAEAYFVCRPKISDFFHLCLHWVSVVCATVF